MEKIQRTLAMVKPDAVDRWPEIEKIILEEGFTIVEVSHSFTHSTK